MQQSDAIELVQDYLNQKPFDWEAMYHVDPDPKETHLYWVFRNLWEPRDPMRGDDIQIDWGHPRIIVHKELRIVQEIRLADFKQYGLS